MVQENINHNLHVKHSSMLQLYFKFLLKSFLNKIPKTEWVKLDIKNLQLKHRIDENYQPLA